MKLIGTAATIHRTISAKITRTKPGDSVLTTLLHGDPGTGKTTVCELLAWQLLTGEVLTDIARLSPTHPRSIKRAGEWIASVESISAVDVDVDTVRQWAGTRGMASLFGEWRIRIEELDAMPHVAQTAMLKYMDSLPGGTAILASSNANTGEFQRRFQSRFQCWQCDPPADTDIAALLAERFPDIPATHAIRIAALACGDVRQAYKDAESWQDTWLVAA